MRKTPATLLLVRHAQTNHNAERRLSGWTDDDLSEHGLAQCELLAEHINHAHQDLAAIYTSPLRRARRTAEAIAALTGHPLTPLDDLREMHFGDLDGRPMDELKDEYAELLAGDEDDDAHDFAWPNGESRRDFAARVVGVLDYVAGRHRGEPVCVVTHGGVIATSLTIIHGEPTSRWRKWVGPNASLTELQWECESHSGVLLRHGDAAHLAHLSQTPPSPP